MIKNRPLQKGDIVAIYEDCVTCTILEDYAYIVNPLVHVNDFIQWAEVCFLDDDYTELRKINLLHLD